ncbi:protein phosphatase 2C-like domain-containing protein 1 [Oncorhynchus masou masou]|uniref:protein phosphatase 2C-like domain-containing protein 1 n=1 Tax=Oncorhynchus masou masou TaxID=90313 RepID=UPI00318318ED
MDSCIPIEGLPGESFDSSPDTGSPYPSQHHALHHSGSNIHGNPSSNLEKGKSPFSVRVQCVDFIQLQRMAEYSVTTHKGSNPFIRAVAVCEEKNSTWKKNMEDVTIFHEGYGGKEGTSFFGVFDGFHGQISAVTASREMPVLVLEQLSKQDPLLSLEKDQVKLLSRFEALFQKDYNRPYPGQAQNIGLGLGPEQLENLTNVEQVNLAFTTAFWKMDRVLGLGKNETSKIRWSGCTALLCLIDSGLPSSDRKEQGTGQESNTPTPSQELQGGRILIANCGNVHAVLYKQGRGFRLTKDHSTSNPKERKRILQSGGAISVNKQHGLVEGLTEATRGLGHYGDRKLKKSVIPVPYSVSLPTDPSFQMLVLASSGLWEVLDEHAVAERALTVIEFTQQKLIVKTLCLMQTVEDSSVSDSQSCIQSRPGSSIFDSEEPSSVKDKDNPPELDMPEPLGVQARDIQNAEETERHQSLVLQQESEVNVKGTMADSLKNLTLDYERLAADICRELVDTALVSGSRENISVIVILLHGLDVLRENTLKGELTKQTNSMEL